MYVTAGSCAITPVRQVVPVDPEASQAHRWPGPHTCSRRCPQMAIDTRHRDKSGEISRKHGNSLIHTLRKTYGQSFAKGCGDDEKLNDVVHKLDLIHLIHD